MQKLKLLEPIPQESHSLHLPISQRYTLLSSVKGMAIEQHSDL